MKCRLLLYFIFIQLTIELKAQNVGINISGATPNTAALLDIDAAGTSPKLGLLIPRITSAEKTAITLSAAAQGLVIYQTDGVQGFYYNTSITTTPSWSYLSPSGTNWSIAGNALTGTLPATPTEWIGSTNAADWIVKTNGAERMRINSLGNVGINTATASILDMLDVTSSNGSYNAILGTHTSAGVGTAYYGVGGTVINAAYTTAAGYLGYHNSGNKTFGVYGASGDMAGLFLGKVGINSVPSALTSADLEIRNTAAGNPAVAMFHQTASQSTSGTVLNRIDFGDNYQTTAEAQITAIRGAAGGAGDLPTDLSFSNTPDASAILTERMRILYNGNVGIGTAAPTQLLHVAGGSVLTNRAYAASTTNVAANTAAFNTGANPLTQVQITDNGSSTANGSLTYGATAIEGQYVWITNNDAQSVPFASTSPSTTIPAGKTMCFVYINSAWESVSADNANSLNWTTTGNTGTTAGSNFMGTTDSVALVFKTNNHQSGRIGLITSADNNTSFGALAMNSISTGHYNTAVGSNAMLNSTTGNYNAALGYQAMRKNTSGTSNTAIGAQALDSNTVGSANTALGTQALRANVNGFFNSALGYQALTNNTSGSANTAIGYASLGSNSTGGSNTGLGFYSLYNNISGSFNTGIGRGALFNDTTGNNNTAVGYQALYQNGYGKSNTGLGYGTLLYNETGDSNVAIGYYALRGATTGSTFNNNNVALGSNAGLNMTTGYNNVLVGNNSGRNIMSGFENVFFGNKSGYSNTSGNNNLFYGNYAGYKNVSGGNNIFLGQNSGYNNGGNKNIFIGQNSGMSNLLANSNIFIGYESGYYNTTGYENVYIGERSGYNNLSGVFNTSIGYLAGGSNVSSSGNTFVGMSAGYYTEGGSNTAMGYNAGLGTTTGAGNTMYGAGTGGELRTGDDNTYIGNNASSTAGGDFTNSAAFGANALAWGSNYQRFGDASVLKWGFGTNPIPGRSLQVGSTASNGNGAYLTNGGAWTNASDRDKKTDITPLNGREILFKIRQLDITRWRYKGTTEGDEYHVGPMAQDFYRLFQVGIDSLSISTIDPAGVSLIGVKQLSIELEEVKKENAQLRKEIEILKTLNSPDVWKKLEELQAQLNALKKEK